MKKNKASILLFFVMLFFTLLYGAYLKIGYEAKVDQFEDRIIELSLRNEWLQFNYDNLMDERRIEQDEYNQNAAREEAIKALETKIQGCTDKEGNDINE